MQQATIDVLAEAAYDELTPVVERVVGRDPVIALGAGQTAARAIRVLADRHRADVEAGLAPSSKFVAASNSSEILAKDLGLPVIELAMCDTVDVFIDGADEVDRRLRVMKGTRGSMARERVLAWASKKNIYMVRGHKVSESIGEKATLSIAVMAFGLEAIRAALRQVGVAGVVRRTLNGELFITDNGNLILDVDLSGEEDLPELAAALNDIPGIVDHGLFLAEADVVLIEHKPEPGETDDPSVRIERLERQAQA